MTGCPAPVSADDALDLDAAPTIAPVDIGKGWYLRGDLGTSSKLSTGSASFSTSSGSDLATGSIRSQSYQDNDLSINFGLGYRFNDILRADATMGFLNGKGTIGGTTSTPCEGAPAGTNCDLSGSANVSNYEAMLNAYADLATVSGFTPYVGAGVGFTRVDWQDSQMSATCVNGASACLASTTSNYTNQGTQEWRRSWALMAGISYAVSDKLSADIGYRFSRTGSGQQWSASNGAFAKDGGFDRHELRFGLRLSP